MWNEMKIGNKKMPLKKKDTNKNQNNKKKTQKTAEYIK